MNKVCFKQYLDSYDNLQTGRNAAKRTENANMTLRTKLIQEQWNLVSTTPKGEVISKTLPKAQRTLGLRSGYQSNFFRSYHKYLHKF